jgi:hypothetical protein
MTFLFVTDKQLLDSHHFFDNCSKLVNPVLTCLEQSQFFCRAVILHKNLSSSHDSSSHGLTQCVVKETQDKLRPFLVSIWPITIHSIFYFNLKVTFEFK